MLSPIDFLAGAFAGADVLLAAVLAAVADLAGVADVRAFDFVAGAFAPSVVVDRFIAFALPVGAGFALAPAFEAVGFLLEALGVFAGALFLVAPFAVALVADEEPLRCLDAVAMEVSVAAA